MRTKQQIRKLYNIFDKGGSGPAVGAVSQKIFDKNIWIEYQRRKSEGDLIPLETYSVKLFLDPDDSGLSQELLYYGVREEKAVEKFRRELKRLESNISSSINVLEIGANKGYYAFQMSDILGNNGQIYASEPGPKNIKSLELGIKENGFDNITLHQGAIGKNDGQMEMNVSNRSNWHTLTEPPKSHEHVFESKITVDVWSVDTFIEKNDLQPQDINVVRMDVEGYEYPIFNGLRGVFNTGKPDLIFAELHPHMVEYSKLCDILDILENNEMELVMAESPENRSLSNYQNVRDHLSITDGSHSTEIIARKP